MRSQMRGMNPRQQKMMMKRAGLNFESVEDVREVIIRTGDGEYHFDRPDVSIMTMQGQKTWQVTGEPTKRSSTAGSGGGVAADAGGGANDGGAIPEEEPASLEIPPEDVALVAQQTGASEQEALEALRECEGNPAEAIIRLMK